MIGIIFFCIGLLACISNQRPIFLLCLLLISTSFLKFMPSVSNVFGRDIVNTDFALVLMLVAFILPRQWQSETISKLQRGVIIFIIYVVCISVYDLFFNSTSFGQVVRVNRKILFLLFIFCIDRFSLKDYSLFFKYFFKLILFGLIGYFLQPILGISLFPGNNEALFQESRFSIFPSFSIVALIFFLLKSKQNLLYILLFISLFVVSQTRSVFIGGVLMFVFYLFYYKKFNFIALIVSSVLIFLGFILTPILFPAFFERLNSLISISSISSSIDTSNYSEYFHQGSITFRYALTYERIEYLSQNFKMLFFGAGFIPDSDLTQPIFILGTYSDSLFVEFEQYNTADILYPNLLMRYGLIGLILFFILLIWPLIKIAFIEKSVIFITLALSIIFYIGSSVATDFLYDYENWMLFYLLVGMGVSQLEHNKIKI